MDILQTIDLSNFGVFHALAIVVAAILADTVLGILKTFKAGQENFNLRKLPQFLATGVLPYAGGLGVIAIIAGVLGEPYTVIFYPVAATALLKYLADIKDSWRLYSVSN